MAEWLRRRPAKALGICPRVFESRPHRFYRNHFRFCFFDHCSVAIRDWQDPICPRVPTCGTGFLGYHTASDRLIGLYETNREVNVVKMILSPSRDLMYQSVFSIRCQTHSLQRSADAVRGESKKEATDSCQD